MLKIVLVFPQTLVIKNLGISLKDHLVPNAPNVLREVWKMVTKVKDSERFMACAEAWIYFIVKHFKVINHYNTSIKINNSFYKVMPNSYLRV